jgi:amino acid transporter
MSTSAVEIQTVPANRDGYLIARWCCAGVALILLIIATLQMVKVATNSSRVSGNSMINTLYYTEPVKTAANAKLEGAKSLAQVAMLAIAVLWSLIIAKREERAMLLKDRPEVIMFIIANVLFVYTAFSYAIYTDAMSTVHTLGAHDYDDPKELTIMDYRDPRINDLYVWQTWIWGFAMVVTALVLFSAHGLKRSPQKAEAPVPG